MTPTTAMGPPPPRNTTSTSEPEGTTLSEPSVSSLATNTSMGPPPPKNYDALQSDSPQITDNLEATPESIPEAEIVEVGSDKLVADKIVKKSSQQCQNVAVPYTIPPWSGRPCHAFYLEVLKDGSIVEQFDVHEKGAYMFGRVDLCDFVLEHPTISRFHAVLQFRGNGSAYLYDLGSTHGTSINKNQVEQKVYVDLRVGDVIRFGLSSRLYIFQGPPHLMPLEADFEAIKHAKIKEEMHDREASLRRARREASLADGISWGMGEDAIEEVEDDAEEVTWQTFRGQLTEKQEKTRDKIIKRTEKIANMKKEIDAIRAKDIAQGGLTQGQQTQIARNEERTTKILEELENLEETLNESVRESLGARSGKITHGKKRGTTEDEEEILSDDDDDFYDRTKKPPVRKPDESKSVETADTLLDKRGAILKEMEDKKELLLLEKNKIASETEVDSDNGDALDAFMSGLSNQLVVDKTEKLQKEFDTLQTELDRVLYLLKIADPTGEAIKKRDLMLQDSKSSIYEIPAPLLKKLPPVELRESSGSTKPESSMKKEATKDATMGFINTSEVNNIGDDTTEERTVVYTVTKPQWLGAVEDMKTDVSRQAVVLNTKETDDFVDYKDRKEILVSDPKNKVDVGIEDAAPGLIIRKRKQVEISESSDIKDPEQSTSSSVEDAVALLLKHTRGYVAEDDGTHEDHDISSKSKSVKDKKCNNQSNKDNKKPKRVLGPEKPSFLVDNSDYDSSWVPPKGQSGDGRTSLNDQFGY